MAVFDELNIGSQGFGSVDPLQVGSVADLPEDKANKFSTFVDRLGAREGSLLRVLGGAFGQSENEIRARRRVDLENKLFEKQAAAALSSTPGREILKDVTGVNRFIDTGEQVFEGVSALPDKPSAFREKINAMVSNGVPLERATKIASGTIRAIKDEVSGEAFLFDLSTGKRLDSISGGEADVINDITETQTIPAPDDPQEIQTVGDVRGSFGPEGFLTGIGNKFSDIFTGELSNEKVAEGSAAIENLNNVAIQIATSNVSGRPNVEMQNQIRKTLIEPQSFFTGPGEAAVSFQATVNLLDGEANRLQDLLDSNVLKPAFISASRNKISQLNDLSKSYTDILGQLDPAPSRSLKDIFAEPNK